MDPAGSEIILAEHGRAGLVRLSRPAALNALTRGMIRELEAFYHRCAKDPHIYGIVMEAEGKAFSAGGDIRAIRDCCLNSLEGADRFFAEEYQHNWTLQRFRKMPGMTGMYLGLTGRVCNRADAYYTGVATHCIPASQFETIKAAMIEGEPIDPVADGLHEHPGQSTLEKLQEPIGRIFASSSLDDILRGLEREQGPWRAWARETLETLSKRSPLALKVTFEHLKRGRNYKNLKEALIVEYRLAARMIRQPDFLEGVRAVILDGDRSPKWRPSSLNEVSGEFVQSLFEPLPGGGLQLTDSWTPPARS
ncbi:MAG: enoyl-CoA hydratase/isomerase family protein [Rhodomicrobium sp.]|nr:enoyl-CoA hydratase/isomerase family protein [Rhodomicrobium sp.]